MTKISKNQEKIRYTFKKVLIDWSEISTVHPIPRIRRSNSIFLRILWLCCLVLSGGYCVCSIVVSIQTYFKYQTLTSTEIISETPTKFPAISFCNYKMLNKLSSREFQQSEIKDQLINGDDIYDYVNENAYAAQVNLSYEMQDFKRLIGYNLSDILVRCAFNRKRCSIKDFSQFFHPIHGNCFTFNSNLSQTKQVTMQGLLLLFNYFVFKFK